MLNLILNMWLSNTKCVFPPKQIYHLVKTQKNSTYNQLNCRQLETINLVKMQTLLTDSALQRH